jgi:hypothetical protein
MLMKDNASSCYECGYFVAGQKYSIFVAEAIKHLLMEIRPFAISLVESYGISDQVLTSAIGNSYGDIYETHLRWAKGSKLN